MTRTPSFNIRLATVIVSALACCAASCSTSGRANGSVPAGAVAAPAADQQAPSTPLPLVRDCTIISFSVPTKYACDGKVYTSHQLAKARADVQTNGSAAK